MPTNTKNKLTLDPKLLARHYGYDEPGVAEQPAEMAPRRPRARPEAPRQHESSDYGPTKLAIGLAVVGALVYVISVGGEKVMHNQEHNPWQQSNTPQQTSHR